MAVAQAGERVSPWSNGLGWCELLAQGSLREPTGQMPYLGPLFSTRVKGEHEEGCSPASLTSERIYVATQGCVLYILVVHLNYCFISVPPG